ncbi:sn-glycerol-3-phosphate ABC transporter ATP-binding protein UgpC [Acerihabitans sp. TG2]|uniref:ABC transporter ATP-binding protein n=1 Tax=Acerihabitans sp. TG2 TaxID=3096008 RepID=UPI002B239A9E|nr:sn-glycerol-3-phosphate ABC transporter ATP-binding protein UgpC [Acerihabitans sp. TG2]MEA9390288.1 sn-glycerol-3-phosphate ABC transporter ATP-binding protein UgpC [Acerihabitans sp. TG2]
MASVELVKVAKRYGKNIVLNPLDLTIPDGSFTVLVGPSGCGKSTLLRLLAGLDTVSDGDIFIDKQQINNLDPADRDIAMVFQSYALYPHLTVAENMAFHMQVKKIPRQQQQTKVEQIARMLGIEPLLRRLPKALSGGQRQRVAMGRAMVRNPRVFLFDEPLSNLDAQLRMELRAEIKSLHQQLKTTTVYVTHDQVEAMTLADQIVVMKQGSIVQQGQPLEIYDRPVNTFVARFIGSPPMNLLEGRITMQGGRPGVSCGDLWFLLPEKWREAASLQGDAPVTLGIRPHDFVLVSASNQPAASLRLMEKSGESSLLHVTWAGFPLHVQFAGRSQCQLGQPLWLEPKAEEMHLFDTASGNRLGETLSH